MNRVFAKVTLVASLVAAAAGVHAAGAAPASDKLLPNGKSVYGQPVTEPKNARVINLDARKSANVDCGDTVVFQKGSQRFAWKFETTNHGAVDLRAIAPAGFTDTKVVVYVSRSDAERS